MGTLKGVFTHLFDLCGVTEPYRALQPYQNTFFVLTTQVFQKTNLQKGLCGISRIKNPDRVVFQKTQKLGSLRSKCTGKKLPFLFFSMILHVFLSRPFQGQNLEKIYGTQKWQKTMENFRREFREHRKISVDRLCSFGIYYLISSAWASSIFEKRLYLFIIFILIILSSTELLILCKQCFSFPQAPE